MKLISQSIQKRLQDLVERHAEAEAKLDKQIKSEYYFKIAAVIGGLVLVAYLFMPKTTLYYIGEIGKTLSIGALFFGSLAWFFSPSKEGVELIEINAVSRQLEELGFEPYVLNKRVFLKDDDRAIDPYDDQNFSIKSQIDIPF